MRYSTGLKKRSRLQGHRKRRRGLNVFKSEAGNSLGRVEYKALRQYRSMGDMLDEFRTYGFRAGKENLMEKAHRDHDPDWMTFDME
ncbi:MAG: hypothetical protein HZB83_05505 [Deltaproteobacteria bacterium]|nr:hypothetical protein [Deltaproteobacteria bacterium]